MKQWKLALLVVAGLVAVAVILRGRDRMPETPEDAVAELFDAAERGDDAAYLRLTCGKLRESLGQSRTEMGPAAFRENLKQTAMSIQGLAVLPNDNVPPQGVLRDGLLRDVLLRDVELIFKDRTERQTMLFLPKGNGWAIASMETASTRQQEIPWGTPVFEDLPPTTPSRK